jgi:hypothetical protein
MGDALHGIREAVGEIVHGINAPFVAGAVMMGLADAVNGGVPHQYVGMGHVDFGPQHMGAIFEFTVAHALEQVEVFFHRPVAMRALSARFGECAAVFADLFGTEAVHIGLAVFDQTDGEIVELFEIIGGIVFAAPASRSPASERPLMESTYSTSSLAGLVSSKRRLHVPPNFGQAEIQADRLGVADMQVTVGFRRETGGHPAVVRVVFEIFLDDGFDKVGRGIDACICHIGGLPFGCWNRSKMQPGIGEAMRA